MKISNYKQNSMKSLNLTECNHKDSGGNMNYNYDKNVFDSN